ncbi:MAG: type I glyceraldehyde-3-phosphate dehydrogenase [Candidatus Eisenbacteria bacterium]|nr:type I glyceraldehyde-3-phosphate dehydrogenase [Candidatus Eisenbacteria bacterium]
MALKYAINGFGRIGRLVLRIAGASGDFELVALNDLTDATTLAHLLRYDSVHGRYDGDVENDSDSITVDGRKVRVFSERDPAGLPWGDLGVDVIIESTGKFRDRQGASKHLSAGARKVMISAPAKEPDVTIVMGVNDGDYRPEEHDIISTASCTTNCAAPMVKVLLDDFGIERGIMTTVHAYTNDQKILDLPHKDLRRARAAGVSMIPTTTGAAKAITTVIPELAGKLDGMAIRVPTADVSLVDFVLELGKSATADEVNASFKKAASEPPLGGYLRYTEEPLVSIDYVGDRHSCIFDAPLTKVMGGNMVKVLGWYDNEAGYAARMVDMMKLVASK